MTCSDWWLGGCLGWCLELRCFFGSYWVSCIHGIVVGSVVGDLVVDDCKKEIGGWNG